PYCSSDHGSHTDSHSFPTRRSSDLEDVLELSFSKDILKDGDKAMISDEVMETLVRTLTDQEEVEGVKVEVEGVDKLVNENGEAYTEPVTKKTFVPTDKL